MPVISADWTSGPTSPIALSVVLSESSASTTVWSVSVQGRVPRGGAYAEIGKFDTVPPATSGRSGTRAICVAGLPGVNQWRVVATPTPLVAAGTLALESGQSENVFLGGIFPLESAPNPVGPATDTPGPGSILWVNSVTGNDGQAEPGNWGKHYKTIANALQDATAGSKILLTDDILESVNWNFDWADGITIEAIGVVEWRGTAGQAALRIEPADGPGSALLTTLTISESVQLRHATPGGNGLEVLRPVNGDDSLIFPLTPDFGTGLRLRGCSVVDSTARIECAGSVSACDLYPVPSSSTLPRLEFFNCLSASVDGLPYTGGAYAVRFEFDATDGQPNVEFGSFGSIGNAQTAVLEIAGAANVSSPNGLVAYDGLVGTLKTYNNATFGFFAPNVSVQNASLWGPGIVVTVDDTVDPSPLAVGLDFTGCTLATTDAAVSITHTSAVPFTVVANGIKLQPGQPFITSSDLTTLLVGAVYSQDDFDPTCGPIARSLHVFGPINVPLGPGVAVPIVPPIVDISSFGYNVHHDYTGSAGVGTAYCPTRSSTSITLQTTSSGVTTRPSLVNT